MIKLAVYSEKGVKKGSTSLPKNFVEEKNLALLAQAIRVYQDRQHPGLSRVKTRAEVDISKRKIYRQKGTGGARHGAKSAPIFVGGGVTHGPKGVKRILTLPRKMKSRALNAALTLKANEGRVFVIDGMSKLEKTKDVATLINKIAGQVKETKLKENFIFALSDKNVKAVKAIRNIKNAQVLLFKNLNANNVFYTNILVIDKDALVEFPEKKQSKEVKPTVAKPSVAKSKPIAVKRKAPKPKK